MHGPSSDDSLMAEVIATTPGGETLITCLQCGTCGGSCPSGPDMDHTPRQLFAMISAGLREEVLQSNTPWYCVACYLTHHPLRKVGVGPMALDMFSKDRMSLKPDRIKGMGQLRAILDKAKSQEAM